MIQPTSPLTDSTAQPRLRGRKRTKVKHYILDTNVLVHDPGSFLRFEEHTVWIPVEVLEELDHFKSESSTRGANAREVHRKLSEKFREPGDMQKGVALGGGGQLRVAVNAAVRYTDQGWKVTANTPRFQTLKTLFPDFSIPDNRILACAALIADTLKESAILVTKDLNMQLKARALGLEAEDYRTDRIEDVEDQDIRRTIRKTDAEEYASVVVPGHTLQAFASQGCWEPEKSYPLAPNEYVMLRNAENQSHGIPARHTAEGAFTRLRNDVLTIRGGRSLKALNLGQRFLLDALFDPALTLITVYGKAGTGKTLLSVGSALQQVQEGHYDKLLISRVIMPTGRDIGYLPGRLEEKMQPWVQPAYDALELLLSRPRKPEQFENMKQSARKKGKHAPHETAPSPNGNGNGNGHAAPKVSRPYEPLLQNGTIEIEALCHIRGRSIPNSIFIVDEAQQLTPHEAKTLVTRMGKGSKLILIGDLAQIDNPYVDANTNGLVYTRNRLQNQPFMAHINLFKGERSPMAEVAANLM